MRKLFILVFCFITVLAFTQSIHTGKLLAKKDNVTGFYKLYMDSKPTAYFADSGAVWIAVFCPNGVYETRQIGWKDTLVYEFTGKVDMATSINWFKNGIPKGRTDMPAPYVNAGNSSNCYKFISLNKYYVVPPVVLPPVFIPEVIVLNGQIVCNTGGTLVIMSWPNFTNVTIKTYSDSFTYDVSSGWWYYYILLSDGSQLGNEVIQN